MQIVEDWPGQRNPAEHTPAPRCLACERETSWGTAGIYFFCLTQHCPNQGRNIWVAVYRGAAQQIAEAT